MYAARSLSIVAVGLVASGCATIIRGTETDFEVQTSPPGATATLSTGESCTPTPCKIRRPRKEGFTATVTLPGYKPSTTEITHHWSKSGTTTGIIGNAILGGAIGIGVDAATGANQDLFPNPLVLTLEPEAAAASAEPVVAAAPEAVAPETGAGS